MQHKMNGRTIGWARALTLPLLVLLISAGYWRVGRPDDDQPTTQPAAFVSTAPLGDPEEVPSPLPTATTEPTRLVETIAPAPTATATPTPTWKPTATFVVIPTLTPTNTPTITSTPTPTPTPILPTPDGVYREARVPILMYHHIADPPPGADEIRRDLSVSPDRFYEQLRYLKENGYQTITFDTLALHLTVGHPLPAKPVILTFDDGYTDAYAHAFPLLKRFSFSGTFFLITEPIDANDGDYLSWAEVEEMHAAGMEFQPHSYNHPDMTNRGFQFVVFQILAPKEAIEARTGEICRFFAYPTGRYDQFIIDVLRSADFWGGVLTEQGATHTAGDLFTLRRVRIHSGDDLNTFARILNLDW